MGNLVQHHGPTSGREFEPLHGEHLAVEEGAHLVRQFCVEDDLCRTLRRKRHRVAPRVRSKERQHAVNLALLRETETDLPPAHGIVPVCLRRDSEAKKVLVEVERTRAQHAGVRPVPDGRHLLGQYDLGGTDLPACVAEGEHPVVIGDAKVNALILEVDEATGAGLGEDLRRNLPREVDVSSVGRLRCGYGFTECKVDDALPAHARHHLGVGVKALTQLSVLVNLRVAGLLARNGLVVLDVEHRSGHVEVGVEARVDGLRHRGVSEHLETRLRERAEFDEGVVAEPVDPAGASDEALPHAALAGRVLKVGIDAVVDTDLVGDEVVYVSDREIVDIDLPIKVLDLRDHVIVRDEPVALLRCAPLVPVHANLRENFPKGRARSSLTRELCAPARNELRIYPFSVRIERVCDDLEVNTMLPHEALHRRVVHAHRLRRKHGLSLVSPKSLLDRFLGLLNAAVSRRLHPILTVILP